MSLRIRSACALLAAVLISTVAAAAPLPPVQSFFENPGFSGAMLSPDAKFLAVRTHLAGGRDTLAVVDLATMAVKVVASFNDADVGVFNWVNGQRLVFTSTDRQVAQGDIDFAPGLYAVDRDGSGFRQLAERRGYFVKASTIQPLQPWNTYMFRQGGAQNSDSIYVMHPNYTRSDLSEVDLLQLNTVNGRATTVPRPPRARGYLLDQRGEPRIATAVDEGKRLIWYRDPATSAWRKLAEFPLYGDNAGGFYPVGFGPDGALYVQTRLDTDKSALYRFDFATNAINPTPVLRVADYDFEGALITDSDKLLGVRLRTDADTTEWFDPALKSLQARVDAKLPSTINQISVAPRAATPWVLVSSYSDAQPRRTMLFNTETGVFNNVGVTHAAIDPARMGRQELVHYKARDGRSIPAWLTLPPGAVDKNLPMVVLVHGGPYTRGATWGWKADSQFLASRGYAVLEPEYRGSTGYGFDHFQAGWKQWGLKMQDDLADGARWASDKGVADAKRICIAGGGYGGYAALMGLVNDAALFRCGVEWSGITDLDLLFSGHWSFTSDLSDTYKQYGMPVLIGDPKTDHERFQATSPLAQAARITQPLLMAYGAADRHVPLYHGTKFQAALKAGNPNVEFVQYDDEGHDWVLPKNRYDFWTRVERFLDKQIGKARPQ